MRAYFTAETIAALLALGFVPAVWGQQTSGRGASLEAASTLGSSSTIGGGTATTSAGRGTSLTTMGIGVGQTGADRALQSGEFVGASAQDVRDAMMATGASRGGGQTSQQGFSPFGSARGGQARRTTGSRTSRGTSEIRASMRVAFSVARPAPAQLGSKLATRLEKSSWLHTRSPVEVSFEKGTAILRGVVATEHDRVLAERVAMLEPGVRRVENELTVAPPSTSAPSADAATTP